MGHQPETPFVPLCRPHVTGAELRHLQAAIADGHLCGNGRFTRQCHRWLQDTIGGHALLTPSGTGALEMCAMVAGLDAGDEVIMPSYTFPSAANAVALRGAVPVFVDIRADTLNIDETRIEAAITDRTRAIMPVHYAGVGCAMDAIMDIAAAHGLIVIEDAAHGLGAAYKGRPLGGIGHMAAFSFHATKNISAGEGGAFIARDRADVERAEIVWEKGTNRSAFMRGEVHKYAWQDLGGSYLPSELTAAVLAAQLDQADRINDARRRLWQRYQDAFAPLEARGLLRRPIVPETCAHNAHIYYVLLPTPRTRADVIDGLKARGIAAAFHYVPLHDAPAGRRYGRPCGRLDVTGDAAGRLLRLPLFPDLSLDDQDRVIAAMDALLSPIDKIGTKRAAGMPA